MQKAFKTVLQPDEDTKVGDLGDGAVNDIINLVAVGNVASPRVVLHLLQAQRDSPTLLVNRQYLALNLLTLFNDLAGVCHLASPRHVRDMEQAIDAFVDLDEGTIVGEVANHAFDD